MYLTKEEERMLSGEAGPAIELAMRAIVKVGEAMKAERLVEVAHAHVSGISYMNIGEPGRAFIEKLASMGARVKVFSTVNPIGMDLNRWPEMGIHRDFAEKQLSIVRSLTQMGFAPSFTCAPYLLRSPSVGEHLAWGESSAVALANTYYGAMTNREGGPLALLCAIAGRTYEAGLHLSENRVPTIELIVPREISRELSDPGVAGALGYVVGEKLSGHVPLLRGASRMTFESLRAYTAAAGATGDIALTIVEGVTPGWQRALASAGRLERVEIEAEEVRGLLRDLDDSIDTIFIGCPHATLEEIRSVFETLSRRGRAERPRIVVSTSRQVYELAESMGFISRADELGVEIVKDTCPVVSPVAPRLGAVATTSAKCLFYLPRLHGTKAKLIAWSSLGALNVVAQKR